MVIPANPRVFSKPLALAVAFEVVLAAFISMAFEFGSGRFFEGVSSAAGYLLIFSFGLIILAGVAAALALLMGRWIGVTLTGALVFAILAASVLFSYFGSQPISRMRRLVWEAAPASLTFHEHKMYSSFNDGSTYTFIIACEDLVVLELCRAAKLAEVSRDSVASGLLRSYFSDDAFSSDTRFYARAGIELACTPSIKKAFIACSPRLME